LTARARELCDSLPQCPPAHRNPPTPAQDDPPARRTSASPSGMTWAVLATGEAYQRPTHHKKGTKPRRKG
jgi:hypothetical protein